MLPYGGADVEPHICGWAFSFLREFFSSTKNVPYPYQLGRLLRFTRTSFEYLLKWRSARRWYEVRLTVYWSRIYCPLVATHRHCVPNEFDDDAVNIREGKLTIRDATAKTYWKQGVAAP